MLNRAVILAAGTGSRLKWLTRTQPKALMPVSGIAVIVHVIRRLSAQGIRDIAINVHHHADRIRGLLGDGSRYGVRLYFSYEEQLLDSGGGVKRALALLPGEGRFLVHNTDVLSDINLHMLAIPAHDNDTVACLALVDNPSHHPGGDFGLSGGRVVAKDPSMASYTYTGIAALHPDLFNDYAIAAAFSLKTLFDALVQQGRLRGILHQNMWLDIGRPRDWLQASRLMAQVRSVTG